MKKVLSFLLVFMLILSSVMIFPGDTLAYSNREKVSGYVPKGTKEACVRKLLSN